MTNEDFKPTYKVKEYVYFEGTFDYDELTDILKILHERGFNTFENPYEYSVCISRERDKYKWQIGLIETTKNPAKT